MCFIARRALAVVLLGVAMTAASTAAWAQAYPDRPLRLVVGFPPGGSGDFLARIVADELTREIGQPVVVDNKPGAGSNIAAEHVARAASDGYTILLAGNFTHAINPWLYKNLSWDPHRDFTPITKVALMSIIVCVAPQRGIGSMKELIARMKSEPGKWFYASPGNGTSQHLAGAELNRLAGTDMQHVPFKGGAPSLQAVLAGDVQVMIGTTPVVLPQIRAGKLVPLALITRAASNMVPGVPGMEEAGVPGLDLGSWWGFRRKGGLTLRAGEGAVLRLKKLGLDFALEASGVDLARPLSDSAFREIEEAFFAGQVLVFRGQKLTAREFLGFARRFGPPEPHVVDQFHHPEYADILILSNVVRDGKPAGLADAGTYFHTDYSYLEMPARATMLHSMQVPRTGGDTLFANQN